MADILDVRDLIGRFEELETELLHEEQEEYRKIKALLEELKGCGGDEEWRGDWYPVTLINDDYFETAMAELLEDIGDIPANLPSYLKITIDYDALQQDYSQVEYDNETYWYR